MIFVSNDKTPKSKETIIDNIYRQLTNDGYSVVEVNINKPWGAYLRLSNNDALRFIEEYFPGLSYDEACLGVEGAELSPKILYVEPRQRLSWQYHARRAERWMFITDGAYCRSVTDNQGEVVAAKEGVVVQFTPGERHRLIGDAEGPTIVAEIWQHIKPDDLSNEDDIVRLEDDYSR